MFKYRKCPKCQSARTKQHASSHLRPLTDRVCRECGTIWRPGTPRPLAYALILAGILLPIAVLTIDAAMKQDFQDLNQMGYGTAPPEASKFSLTRFVAIGSGLIAIIYGIRVVRGRAGQLHVLGRVEPERNVAPVEPAEFAPGDRPCVSCFQPVAAGERTCRHCGWTQPA